MCTLSDFPFDFDTIVNEYLTSLRCLKTSWYIWIWAKFDHKSRLKKTMKVWSWTRNHEEQLEEKMFKAHYCDSSNEQIVSDLWQIRFFLRVLQLLFGNHMTLSSSPWKPHNPVIFSLETTWPCHLLLGNHITPSSSPWKPHNPDHFLLGNHITLIIFSLETT